MRSKYFLLGLFSLLLTMSASKAAWNHLPMGQPFVSNVCDDSLGDRVFLNTADAGLWKSQNGGVAWTAINSRLRPGGHVIVEGLRAIDSQADTLIAATKRSPHQANSCIRSFDGGATWQDAGPNPLPSTGRLAVWRGGHNVWLYCDSIWEPTTFRWSTDYGQTWPQANMRDLPQNMYIEEFYQDPQRDSTLFFAGDYFPQIGDTITGGIYRSDDLGRTWRWQLSYLSQFGVGMAMTRDIVRLSNGDLAVAAWTSAIRNDIFMSADDGETWSRLESVPDALNPSQIVEDLANPGRLLVTGHCPGGVARSDDGGQTWRSGLPGLPLNTVSGVLYQNPFSGKMYFTTQRDGLFRSSDHGDAWQSVNSPPIGISDSYLSVTSRAMFAYEGSEDGWTHNWRYETDQARWQELSVSDSVIQGGPVIYSRGDTLYALTSSGQMLRSTDNGQVWVVLSTAAAEFHEAAYSVHSSETSTDFLVADWSNVFYRTTDFGSSWLTISSLPHNFDILSLSQTPSAIYAYAFDGYHYPDGHSVFRTTDGGATWDTLQPPGLTAFTAALIGDEVFADGLSGCLHWSAGVWDTLPPLPFGGDYRFVYWTMVGIPVNPARLVGTRWDSLSLWLSENGGHSWMQRDIQLPYSEQNATWSGLTYDEPRQRLWVCAGVGVCYLDIAELSAPGPLHFLPADFTVLKAYPNPFNPTTRIRFDLQKRGNVKVDVFDLQGRLVHTLLNGMQESGRHEVLFDGSALASGTYFVRLKSPFATRTEKLLLLK